MNTITRIRRWLLLDLTGIEFTFSSTPYPMDDDPDYHLPASHHQVIKQANPVNGGDTWWCRVKPYQYDNQATYSGANIRRAYKPGLLWMPYLRLLEAIGYRPSWSNWKMN